ncbi:MAG: hypothetical protein J0I10_09450 [Verrucomicrobia bacterium]|nr:hypothetical protein [Verrucomicrobiota bacterium]
MKLLVLATQISAAALLALGGAEFARAETIVADTFALNASGRTQGVELNGLAAETGSDAWKSNARFGPMGGITVGQSGADAYGLISLPTNETTLAVEANVVTATSGWISVGFQKTSSKSNWYDPANSLLFALLEPNGRWQLKSAGATLLASGTLTDFEPGNAYKLELRYNPASGTASVFVNDINVSGERAVQLSDLIGSAGFFFYGNGVATTAASLRDFSVTSLP